MLGLARALSSNPIFYKDFIGKGRRQDASIPRRDVQKFVEPYTRTEMSPENREQTAFLLGGLWKDLCTEVAQSRRLPVEAINNYANQYQNFADQVYISMKSLWINSSTLKKCATFCAIW